METPIIEERELISSYEKMKALNLVDPDDMERYTNLRYRNIMKQFLFFGLGLLSGSILQMARITKKWKDNRRYYLFSGFMPVIIYTFFGAGTITNELIHLDDKYKPIYKEYLTQRYIDEQRILELEELKEQENSFN